MNSFSERITLIILHCRIASSGCHRIGILKSGYLSDAQRYWIVSYQFDLPLDILINKVLMECI